MKRKWQFACFLLASLAAAAPATASDESITPYNPRHDLETKLFSPLTAQYRQSVIMSNFVQGDVFVGVANGKYYRYDNAGVFQEVIDQGLSGFTTGAAFDAADRFYTTNFTNNAIYVFDSAHPHGIITSFTTGSSGGATNESIVFAGNGDFYVGHATGSGNIDRYNSSNVFQASYDVSTENVGSDWIELAADQRTIYYTSEGGRIMRFDVLANTQLADFANIGGRSFALRLLPPGDGTGGLIVANQSRIVRLDGSGGIAQVYDAPGEDNWFAMNLDPNGTSFWGADFGTSNFYRFNIASGAVEVGPINTGTGASTVFGLAVFGELTVALCPQFIPPTPGEGTQFKVSVGENLSFALAAQDGNPADVVTISGVALPAGSTFNGIPGNPATATFSWTPGFADLGVHVLEFRASDGDCETPRRFVVEVNCPAGNQPPAFTPPTPECGSVQVAQAGTPITFTVCADDAEAGPTSLDVVGLPAGATMTPPTPTSGDPVCSVFEWTPTAADAGDHLVVFTAVDACGAETRCPITIRVLTNRDPDCSAAVACVDVLWPPNHKYRPVTICGVTDPDGDEVTITVTSITQDEPLNTRGDGNTCPDAQIVDGQAAVRAERTGNKGIPGNGRVYQVNFTASDGNGGECQGSVTVCVPHDQGQSSTCIDDGQRYSSTGSCTGGDALAPEVVSLQIRGVTNNVATISFGLPTDSHVEIAAFDVGGRSVGNIENGMLTSGSYERSWDMTAMPKGLYFVRLRAGGITLSQKVLKAH